MKLQTICLALAFAGCAVPKSPAPPLEAPLTPTLAANATFRVNTFVYDEEEADWADTGTGTGWIARNDTDGSYIVTAGHVCDAPPLLETKFTVTTAAGLEYPAVLESRHGFYDLCLLRSPEVLGPSLRIAKNGPTYDEPLMSVGAPLGVFGCNSGATIEQCGMAPISRGYYAGGTLVSMPMYGGNSGGAVFTSNGVIGVLVEGYRIFPHLSFIEPLDHLKDLLD